MNPRPLVRTFRCIPQEIHLHHRQLPFQPSVWRPAAYSRALSRPCMRHISSSHRPLASSQLQTQKPGSFKLLHDVPGIRKLRNHWRKEERIVGVVPTMGALHDGHLALVDIAAAESDHVIVTIYVNPTQFGINEDLSKYPRTLDSDLEKLNQLNIDLAQKGARGRISAVFAPSSNTMYPTLPPTSAIDGHGTFVTVSPIGNLLEGVSRPVFFRGVATVCAKLFNILTPDFVYFGQKDVQQSRVILRLVKDLHIDTSVRICPTSRDTDGLALSSRNVYLGTRRRALAPILYNALSIAQAQILAGRRHQDAILAPVHEYLNGVCAEQAAKAPSERTLFTTDYFALSDPDTMEDITEVDSLRGVILSGAVVMQPLEEVQPGEDLGFADGAMRPVRLIDNIIISPEYLN